jgi:hypothetical protein
MTLWLLFLVLFPKESIDMTYALSGAASGEMRVVTDGRQFRLDYPGGKTVSWDGKALQQLDGGSWSKVKGILYTKETFPMALFVDTEKTAGFERKSSWTLLGGKLKVEASFDGQGLAEATLTHSEWGTAEVKRFSASPVNKIAEGTFPESKGGVLSGASGLKGLVGLGDQKDTSATAGARGVGEEKNLDAPPNYAAVDEVERMGVTSSEVDGFATAGGLK